MTRIIGITGGIGSGKSTVSDHLRDRGFTVVDADEIARDMTAKGSPVLGKIAEVFGEEMIREGELDRKAMAQMVFSDRDKKRELEDIITLPTCIAIRDMAEKARQEDSDVLWFLDAPLLFEFSLDEICDETWAVCADTAIRTERVMERENCTRQEVEDRMRAQMPDEEKERLADFVIDNSGRLEDTLAIVDKRVDLLLNCN